MAKKKHNNFDEFVKKYQPVMHRTGEQLSKAVKVGEKDIARRYKIARTHVALLMKHLQAEKLCNEIGKHVAEKLITDSFDPSSLDKYKSRLQKIRKEDEKINRKLAGYKKAGKKKRT